MRTNRPSSVSIESLLQLKRAEQPPAEFWAEFDKELRAKQLVAIMEKRPGWAISPRILARAWRSPAFFGATAALAVTVLAFHQFHSRSVVPVEPLHPDSMRAPLAVAIPAASAATPVVALAKPGAVQPADTLAASTSEQVSTVPSPGSSRSASVASRIEPFPVAVAFAPVSGLRLIAANFAPNSSEAPDFARNLFGATQTFVAGNHFQATRTQVVDPLTQMAPPATERRARILAEVMPAMETASEPAAPSSDRLVRRLSDDRLYESTSRYGASGDHFMVKF